MNEVRVIGMKHFTDRGATKAMVDVQLPGGISASGFRIVEPLKFPRFVALPSIGRKNETTGHVEWTPTLWFNDADLEMAVKDAIMEHYLKLKREEQS